MLSKLRDSDKVVRMIAVRMIAMFEPAKFAPHAATVAALLEDPERRVRKAAVETLSKVEAAALLSEEHAAALARAREAEGL